MPTPKPTVIINSHLPALPPPGIMSFTCSASTERSGSAIVMSKPITKHTEISIITFFDLVRPVPTCPPIGVIARSAPRLNSAMPNISPAAEMQKATVSVTERLTRGVKDIISTITVTGRTETTASFNLESKILNITYLPGGGVKR